MDQLRGDSTEGSYDKLFAEELYSNTDLRMALDWEPRYRFEDLVDEIVAGAA